MESFGVDITSSTYMELISLIQAKGRNAVRTTLYLVAQCFTSLSTRDSEHKVTLYISSVRIPFSKQVITARCDLYRAMWICCGLLEVGFRRCSYFHTKGVTTLDQTFYICSLYYLKFTIQILLLSNYSPINLQFISNITS